MRGNGFRDTVPEDGQDFSQLLLREDIEKHFSLTGTTNHKNARLVNRFQWGLITILRHGIVAMLVLLVMVELAPGILVNLIRNFSFYSSVVPMKLCEFFCSILRIWTKSMKVPLASGLRWETIPGDVDYWSERIYMGEPSKESEMAWNKLLSSMCDVDL